jgi:hypothetical protein
MSAKGLTISTPNLSAAGGQATQHEGSHLPAEDVVDRAPGRRSHAAGLAGSNPGPTLPSASRGLCMDCVIRARVLMAENGLRGMPRSWPQRQWLRLLAGLGFVRVGENTAMNTKSVRLSDSGAEGRALPCSAEAAQATPEPELARFKSDPFHVHASFSSCMFMPGGILRRR